MKNWGDTLEIIFSENHFVYVIDDKGVARGSISGGAKVGCAPKFWRLLWRS